MTTEKLDAIIFGATGFTGQVVVEEALEILKDFRWGIAGRNENKLKEVLRVVGQRVNKDLSHIPICIADVADEESLQNMAKKCKIVINCCGPYLLYGEAVVMACIAAGTHHVDISGEPQYFNKMQWKYNELAQGSGSYVVSTCAFESIPTDIGVLYAEKNFKGTVNSIELFLETTINYPDTSSKAVLNYGTWESAIQALKNAPGIISSEKKLNCEEVPSFRPRQCLKPWIRKTAGLNSYFLPFPATDRAVVKRSQRLFYLHDQKRPIQFEMYFGISCLFWALLFPFMGIFIFLMAQCKCTRSLLLKHPKFFTNGIISREGPTEANRKAMEFSMTLKAKGWTNDTPQSLPPNKETIVRVSGKDPGYGGTSNYFLTCAKTILKEHGNMPGNGGVYPPGYAFAKTKIIEELSHCKNGLKFEVIKN